MLTGDLKTSLRNAIATAAYVVIACLLMLNNAWANDYKDGLAAYIDGDFRLAQEHWLRAANNKDGKSMFNLGLLHEQNKLDSFNLDKALNWYRLAADNGYAPAAYHLAQRMLERGGSDDDAIALIERAAQNGYAPAIRHLGIGRLPKGPVKTTNTLNVAVDGYQSNDWINRQRGQDWTIQLLAFKGKEQVVAFIKEHRLQEDTAYFSEVKDGQVFYKLVYGSYNSKDKASFARQNLPTTLQQYGPWLRTWSSVHQLTKR